MPLHHLLKLLPRSAFADQLRLRVSQLTKMQIQVCVSLLLRQSEPAVEIIHELYLLRAGRWHSWHVKAAWRRLHARMNSCLLS
jgi:hypothetical protein